MGQLGGAERRGSYYHDEVTTRASVAMVTDDPEHKKKLKSDLAGAFADNGDLRDILGDLPADASDEEIAARLKAAGLSDSDAKMMMKATKGKGSNLSEARERKDGFEMPDIPNVVIPELREGAVNGVTMRDHSGGAGNIKRGSVKRQSEIMREKKKSRQEERDEERERKASYFRKVTGLRRAKVPLMVYSCGGFSRCFRIARFYDIEGPPVGVEYSRPDDDRKSLNPDL